MEEDYEVNSTPGPSDPTLEQEDTRANGPQEEHFSGEIDIKGELYLSVDKDEYCAGDLVTGHITVLVSEPLHCDALVCTIVGEEIAQWKENADHHSRYHEILRHEVLHQSLANPYDIGEYLYPFTYTLPADLPGVLDAQLLDGEVSSLHATIKYTLTATIKVQGRFISNLEASTNVTLRASPQPFADVHAIERTVSKALRWFGCLSRGTCHLAMSMTHDAFTLGESPVVRCFVNSHTSAVGVHQVKVQLIQKVSVRHTHGDEAVCTRPVAEAKCPGPKAGDLLECPVQLNLDGRVHYPTTIGSFLSCTYSVALICEYAVLINPVRIELPIKILPPARTSSASDTAMVDLAASMASTASERRIPITLLG
ncbi:hypothetical protein BBJ29_009484 [Phytophthora kernoviae]|uniref:Arrestin C-terminal-like domain-containing protein n=1 Tax=Phytophthora kernoviae TaxID=325452 RepID=A0A3F2RBZ0_9STRA|nr:hypothetical protein BBJ29_009484 [Phytophthora kernoviae]RLN52309.1 hypothetical protein BBP00_00009684 [Phytophthora kernoviae]